MSISNMPLATLLIDHSTSDLSLSEPPNVLFIRDRKFKLVFFAICVACFLAAMDLTAIGTMVPAISYDYEHGQEYAWVGSSFAIAATVFIPLIGSLAEIFSRKSIMLGGLVFFAVGSIVVALSDLMSTALLGRVIQGMGAGGILTMTEILVVDTIPLGERGLFFGILGVTWSIASGIGGLTGGLVTNDPENFSSWRWLFWANVPLTVLTGICVWFFLDYVKAPSTTWREKLHEIDYVNILFLLSCASLIVGITSAGEDYKWSSFKVLLPLLLGVGGILVYGVLEWFVVTNPTVPFIIMGSMTSLLGYTCNILHGIVFTMSGAYYLPIYFQAVLALTPLRGGIYLLAIGLTVAPISVLAGYIIGRMQYYKVMTMIGWAVTSLGLGLSTTLTNNSSVAASIGYFVIVGSGLSINFAACTFPVLAPLKQVQQPLAIAFLAFTRAFGGTVGLAVGGTILNRSLLKTLPDEFLTVINDVDLGGDIEAVNSLSYVSEVINVPEPLQSQVQYGFSRALQKLWWGCLACAALGFVLSLFMQEFKLSKDVAIDGWGRKELMEEEIDMKTPLATSKNNLDEEKDIQ